MTSAERHDLGEYLDKIFNKLLSTAKAMDSHLAIETGLHWGECLYTRLVVNAIGTTIALAEGPANTRSHEERPLA